MRVYYDPSLRSYHPVLIFVRTSENLARALSRHFCGFKVKVLQKSFSLTFIRAENIAFKFGLKYLFFLQEQSMAHFWFCLKYK